MKAVSVIGRKTDLDDTAFRAYYEGRHVPLALRLYRFARYRRSYVERLEGALPPFAVMPEFWSVDQAANQAVARSPDGETIRADERQFMAEPRLVASAVETELAFGEEGGQRLVLFARAGEGGRERLRGDLTDWATQLGGGRVTLDETTPLSPAGFFADALVSHWSPADRFLAALPETAIGIGRFTVVETPLAQLGVLNESTAS